MTDPSIHSMHSATPSAALPSYDQAAALVAAYAARLSRLRPTSERVELACAPGRTLAQPLIADRDQPPFTRSTRDGYACRAAEASTHAPLALVGSARAGSAPSGSLPTGCAWEIMNGAPLPSGADAVARFVHVEASGGVGAGAVRLLSRRTLEAGKGVVAQGSQARAGELLLPAGSALDAAQIALAAACGYTALEVFLRPRVAILTTGDELAPVEAAPAPGQIRNSNASMLAALVKAAGGEPWLLPTAADNADALDAALAQAAQADLLLISGGLSAGKFDLVKPALARIGAGFHFTGLRIQPGGPAVFGELPREGGPSQPFFGLPGNPVASALVFSLFAAPVVAALAGSQERLPRFCLARLAPPAEVRGQASLTRFLPAHCDFGANDGRSPQVACVAANGSGDLTGLARSNCFVVAPEEKSRLAPGSLVRILLV